MYDVFGGTKIHPMCRAVTQLYDYTYTDSLDITVYKIISHIIGQGGPTCGPQSNFFSPS